MKIKIQGKSEYWMYFRYPVKEKGQRGVECIVKQEKEELAKASVYCYYNQKFTKKRGRIESIKKVLEILGLSRFERKEFFNQYFSYSKSEKLEINFTKINNKKLFLKELTDLIQKHEKFN